MSSPVKVYKSGAVSVSIFKNTTQDGKDFYSFSFQKSYKKDGEWANTTSFNMNDLPHLNLIVNKLLEKTIKEITPNQNNSNQQQTQQPAQQSQQTTQTNQGQYPEPDYDNVDKPFDDRPPF